MKKGFWWAILSVIIFFGVAGLVYWDYHTSMFEPLAEEEGPAAKVVIPQGTSVSQVIAMLEDAEFEISPTYFRLYLWSNDIAGSLKAGSYTFSPTMSAAEIAENLARGPSVPYMVVTIRPGANMWQITEAFVASGLCSREEFTQRATSWEFATSIGIPEPPSKEKVLFPLEGWLYAETYYITPGQKLDNVLGKMVQLTQNEIREAKKRRIREYGKIMEQFALTDHEFLTIASLIERETSLPHEKFLVSSVFYNRLRKPMKLETDPTLTYTHERQGAVPTPTDRRNAANPYNTYAHEGIPPGPICSPSKGAIEASVGPGKTDFYFFVASGDGSGGHIFSTTYDDHKKAIQVYLKNKKERQENEARQEFKEQILEGK